MRGIIFEMKFFSHFFTDYIAFGSIFANKINKMHVCCTDTTSRADI